ncbi:MAG: hypothetical protein M1825_000532 [Sarcosagium campestre]|nr:MAG: hypothetical protein M1825_000532 [Sarcosagium campestre]
MAEEGEASVQEASEQPGDLTVSTPPKPRSLSDTAPVLSPSPRFREPAPVSKDDISVTPNASKSKRIPFPIRGLSLQMPSKESGGSDLSSLFNRVPLSPKLDSSQSHGSPSSVLPRRSRGLDFSRACTNLHHSTLAEQSSPDSSPILTGRGVAIPKRKGPFNNMFTGESPTQTPGSLWGAIASTERNPMSSSLGSITMVDSDSSDSSSEDEPMDPDPEDTIVATPHTYRSSAAANPLTGAPAVPSPGSGWMGNYSPAASSLMSFQRARLLKRRSRKSSSSASASGGSTMPSPGPASPLPSKSFEKIDLFASREASKNPADSRRTSLTWGTKDLNISSGGDSDDAEMTGMIASNLPLEVVPSSGAGLDEKRGVVRRPVTRRGNLLPKSKNFARIKAALMEEGSPIESEFQREAEVVRQVRESDGDVDLMQTHTRGADLSPTVLPTVPGLSDSIEGLNDDDIMGRDSSTGPSEKGLSDSFTLQVKRHSGGKEFWDKFEGRARMTTPPLHSSRAVSAAVSEDTASDVPLSITPLSSSAPNQQSVLQHQRRHIRSSTSSRSSTPQPLNHPSAAEITRKINKRRRDDDFDETSIKRRAVSPGMSLQNSPILAQSPTQKDGCWSSVKGATAVQPAPSGVGSNAQGERVVSATSNSTQGSGSKRIGFHGMNDTSDGLLKMSIE